MSAEDRETLYPLVINQLLYDGYGVFALSLKKILTPNSETIASNKLLKLVKLGIAVSKYLEDSDNNKDISQIARAFQTNAHNNSSFFSNSSSSNNVSVEQSPQQSIQQNGCHNASFGLGINQSLKLEPGDNGFNSLQFPLGQYQRPWTQVVNRININLDGEIHELPNSGGPTKLFECSLCGKVFNRRDKVKRHLSELHHGIKRHQCVTCARLFSRNDKLIRHIMTVHQGIKAFGCLHCPRRFSRRWEYQRHMQTTHPNLNFVAPKASQNRTPLQASSPTKTPPSLQPQPPQVNSTSNSNTNSGGSVLQPVVSPNPVVNNPAVSSSQAVSTTPTGSTHTEPRTHTMFPVFPVFSGPNTSAVWSQSNVVTSSIATSTSSNNDNATSALTSVTPSSAVSTARMVGESFSNSLGRGPNTSQPVSAPPTTTTSSNHAMFPMFPGFNPNQTTTSVPQSPSCSPPVPPPFTSPGTSNPASLSNTSVFPTNPPPFSLINPYQMNYTNLMTPVTTPQVSQASSAPAHCSSSPTSLSRMLL